MDVAGPDLGQAQARVHRAGHAFLGAGAGWQGAAFGYGALSDEPDTVTISH